MAGGFNATSERVKCESELFSATFSSSRLAKTYPKSQAVKNVRVNGDVGMGQ